MTVVDEVNAGALFVTEVPGMDSAIWTDVRDAGTLLAFEVTGLDHVVRIGGGTYVAMSSSWLLKYPMLISQSLSWI